MSYSLKGENFVGLQFNDLFILKNLGIVDGETKVLCKCICGKEKILALTNVKTNFIKSCGCLRLKNVKKAKVIYDYNEQILNSYSKEMYYILGLMYSDGNLSHTLKRFKITLKESDKYLLEKLGIILKNSNKLRYNRLNKSYELEGNNEIIYNQFLFHGLTPKKSKTLIIKESLVLNSHFWRGMVDGDGWISVSKNKNTLGLCGTINVCENFKKFCSTFINTDTVNVHHLKNRENYGQFAISNKENIKIILNKLYENKGDLFLIRKYNKYLEILNLLKN